MVVELPWQTSDAPDMGDGIALTVMLYVANGQPPGVYVIVAGPAFTPVIALVVPALTILTLENALVHVPPLEVLVRFIELFSQTSVGPDMADGALFTVIGKVT